MIQWLIERAHQGYAAWLRYRIRQQSLARTIRAPFVHGHRRDAEDDPAGRPRPLSEHEHRVIELIEAHERAPEREG